MSLSPHEPRCQGRVARGIGFATLAKECVRCERRTAPFSAHAKNLDPPTLIWCPHRVVRLEHFEAGGM